MTLTYRHHARCACASAHRGLVVRPFTFPGTSRKYERSRPFSFEHIALDLTLDIPGKQVHGVAGIVFERVDPEATELRLDAVGFTLISVTLEEGKGSKPVRYVYDGDVLAVAIPEGVSRGKVEVRYSTKPRRGLYFLAPDEHVRGRPTQVWSQCQDEDARYWFPCHDKPHLKQTTELRVKVPKGWYALSNGTLIGRTSEQDGEIFHWKQAKPHPSYLVTLVAGAFSILDGGTAAGVPITYLVPTGREEDGHRTFARTPAMVEHFSRLTGVPFPWEKYAQVVVSDFIFGGMENTSATTMYEHILLDERAALDIESDDLIAHELAHQWFGDYVTCRDWSHGWLNEGFATFFEHIERERRLGVDEYEYGLKGDLDAYLGEASSRYQRPIVCQDYEAPIDLFDRHLYEKGGWVLHMLRRELGDEIFWKGIRLYLQRHAFRVVETRDLLRALEEVSGRSLERFFDQWVFKAGHPHLEVKVEYSSGALLVEIKQTQKTSSEIPLFAFDLEIDLYPEHGEPHREVLHVETASETFVLPLAERPRFLVLDPRYLLLGELSAEIPADMLRRQLAEAPTARGRWTAALRLSTRDEEAVVRDLATSLSSEGEFWGVRAEAAAALGAIRSPDAMQALLSALPAARHPKVRRAVVAALGKFQKPEAAAALRTLALSDESYLVEAEAARSLGSTRQPQAFDTLVEILDRPSWADVIRSGAVDGLAALRDERAVPHLMARSRYGVPTRARRAAIRALPKIAVDRRTREAIEELLDDPDPYLRIDVVLALGDMGDSKARPALHRALERELDGRVRRRIREVLRDLTGTSRAEQQRLQEEVDRLRSDLQELRLRLAKVEARDDKPSSTGTQRPPPSRTKSAPVKKSPRGKSGKKSKSLRSP
ncbi:MAG: M1 family aminopeptidase [Myxococcales bacterium]|nr:M1 family aminopeptidase [Polyangiaceae bacterium]MDW8247899.1 M1 family aminopeptidase [Myxococcales bacterium]